MSRSQQDIFAPRQSAQRDIFAKAAPARRASRGSIFKHLQRTKGPKPFVIRTRVCKGCGETTTNIMGYRCARKQFGGWWGQWKDMEPCDG